MSEILILYRKKRRCDINKRETQWAKKNSDSTYFSDITKTNLENKTSDSTYSIRNF
jgi:hypothetical protein